MSHHQLGVGFHWDERKLGDNLHVQVEVIDLKLTSKPDRALMRSRNRLLNQHGMVAMVYEPWRMLDRKSAAVCVLSHKLDSSVNARYVQ